MTFINEEDRKAITKEFEKLEEKAKLILFTQKLECRYCEETRMLLEEVASLSDKIELTVYNFLVDKDQVAKYKVDKIPAIVIEGKKDYGIRYYGIPSGYEFGSLIEDIIDVSRGKTDLAEETKEKLATLATPVHLQVFVTPTCPYCPQTVRLAHKFAIESDLVTADMVEAIEFPYLSQRYEVSGVPKTVINEYHHIVGAYPEPMFIEEVLKGATGG
ncbi:MAG: thioredoxin family protein [Acidobacteria bacterium]|nr:thioredoxin family protein [Acidobacteriota bacterium]